jgi:hypothetical protein
MAEVKIPIDLKGLAVVEQVSWAAGDPGVGYANVRAEEIKFEPTIEMHQPAFQKPEANRGPDAAIPGGKGGTLTYKIPLRGGKGAISEFVTVAQYFGASLNVGPAGVNKVKAGSAAGTLVALTVDIGAYVVGDAVMVGGTTTDTQIRFVSRVQDDTPIVGDTTLTIEPNWAAGEIPVVTDTLYSIDTLVPAVGEPSKYFTFQAYSGFDATDRHLYTMTGCVVTWKITTTGPNAIPMVEFTVMVDSWASTEANTTLGADGFNPAHPLLGDAFYIDNSAVKIASIEFDPGIRAAPFSATSGAEGRAGWLAHGEDPVLGFVPYWDSAWVTRWETPTMFEVMFESIKDTDEAWALWCPNVQVLSVGQEDAGNSHLGAQMTLQVNDPGLNADTVNLPRFAIAVTGA